MSRNTDALKRVAVALGFGSAVSDYKGQNTVDVLKEIAVEMDCAESTDAIHHFTTDEVLNYIADNYGSEEHEPYDLNVTETNATVTVKRNGKVVEAGKDRLYNGDKLTITAEGDEGYDIDTLTANDEDIESGDIVTVDGGHVTIVAAGALKKFSLERSETSCTVTVTRNGESVADGEEALTYGDVLTIEATATEGSAMSSLKVNGEDFVSGETLTVDADVEIVGVAE